MNDFITKTLLFTWKTDTIDMIEMMDKEVDVVVTKGDINHIDHIIHEIKPISDSIRCEEPNVLNGNVNELCCNTLTKYNDNAFANIKVNKNCWCNGGHQVYIL